MAIDVPINTNIVATVFGGDSELEVSAYDGKRIGEKDICVALPSRMQVPQLVGVRNRANGRTVVCQVRDVGPWNTNDAYWLSGRRPQAESGLDHTSRRTNKAGIDLSPEAARQLGIIGMGLVDWWFVS